MKSSDELSNPFECPICFEVYSAYNLPTTLPCGHSCCISHVTSLSMCFACRNIIPPLNQLNPTYALRDGAILFVSLARDQQRNIGSIVHVEIDNQKNEYEDTTNIATNIPSKSVSSTNSSINMRHITTNLHSEYETDEQYARRLHSEINGEGYIPQPIVRNPNRESNVVPIHLQFHCPNIGCTTSCRTSTKLQRHLVLCHKPPPSLSLNGNVANNVTCATSVRDSHAPANNTRSVIPPSFPPPPTLSPSPPRPASLGSWMWSWMSHNRSQSHPNTFTSCTSSGSSGSVTDNVMTSTASTSVMTSAANARSIITPASIHAPPPARLVTTVPRSNLSQMKECGHRCTHSSLRECCTCMDRRPMRLENTYPQYVDGHGWVDSASRKSGYCPFCK